MNDERDIDTRFQSIERECRHLRIALVVILIGGVAMSAWTARTAAQQPGPQVVRVRALIVEDEAGQPRVVIGAPIPQSGNRVGLRINDERGVERLGMSLQPNGNMVLGLDAPPGTGDDRNRERITLVADQLGGAYIRFLDRRTSVHGRIYLDEQNRVWMEFSDYTQQPPLRKRIGLSGEEVLRTAQ
jgi:hypothetical protein